ncbi:hypothetical protein F5146DRAFT_1199916 [Armillaria mellea]|nr:hypothetical protein F5146DRAFT_1199916 [Armillaria mellea]
MLPTASGGLTIRDDTEHSFCCVSSDTLPPIPEVGHGFEDPQVVWPSDPEYFIDRHWASNTMPYQGFIPVNRSSVFQCELFQPLNHTLQSIPIHSSGPKVWVIESALVEKWKNIETLLQHLKRLLEDQILTHRNLGHISFPPPWKYRYQHTKHSRMAMAHAAIRSRDAFIIMAAELSYLLGLASAPIHEDDQFHLWSAVLTEQIGGKWVDTIRSSWLVQRDAGYWEGGEHQSLRVGLFVDARTCNFAELFHVYRKCQVPLWIDWGTEDTPYHASDVLMAHYHTQSTPHRIQIRRKAAPHSQPPTFEMLQGKWRERLSGEIFEIMHKRTNGCDIPLKVSTTLDPLDQTILSATEVPSDTKPLDTGIQSPGETWQTFFERRDCEVQQLINNESVWDKQRRKVREVHAKKHLCPKAESRVFYWCTIKGAEHLCRKLIPQSAVPDFWDDYTPSQRRYSAYWNEWDLNFEFELSPYQGGPLPIQLTDDELEEGEICGPSEGPAPDIYRGSIKDWELVHNRTYGAVMEELCPKSLFICSLDDTLRFWFGIMPVASSSLNRPPTTLLVSAADIYTSMEKQKVLQLCRDLGCSFLPSKAIGLQAKTEIIRIPEGLRWLSLLVLEDDMARKPPPCPMPPLCWDVTTGAPHRLSRETNPDFTVHIVRWYRSDKVGFEIRPVVTMKHTPYRFIVYRAMDVLHCLRLRNATCLDDFAEEMCRYGARLTMCVDDAVVGPCRVHPQGAIPYRPVGFKPDLSDFAYYVRKRRALLEDPAVARAALMQGGLIWRIAMEHVPDPEFILSGPGNDMSNNGICHHLQATSNNNTSHRVWAEGLSEKQIDLICGVYRVYRSASSSTAFTQDLSWFPREHSFKNSGLDLGHWSADAEDWYQRRVQLYLNGDPKGRCLNQAEWKSSVRLWRSTTRTYRGMEVVSRGFINRHIASL